MKPVLRYQSQLLYRRSYKPARRDWRLLGVTFRPARAFALRVKPVGASNVPGSVDVTAPSG